MQAVTTGTCYDEKEVTFPIEFQELLHQTRAKPIVLFGTGGLCYSPELLGPQARKFGATHITHAGFVPTLRLMETRGKPPRVISATPTRKHGVPYIAIAPREP